MNITSIQTRLQRYSKKHQKTHQFTLTRFFQERFLYRLSISTYRENFLLKGGALIYTLGGENSRYTKDIDLLLTKSAADQKQIQSIFKEISQIQVEDGVVFHPDIRVDPIQKEGQYSGTRIRIPANLGNIKHNLQIDIGVGDYVTPGPQEITYPTLLQELESPLLQAYSIESVISEKFEAMVSLGDYNSRLKDFYDVYLFASKCDQPTLEKAIRNTFSRRKTPVIQGHSVFSPDFYREEKRKKQWQIFLKKNQLPDISFDAVYEEINTILKPIYDRIQKE